MNRSNNKDPSELFTHLHNNNRPSCAHFDQNTLYIEYFEQRSRDLKEIKNLILTKEVPHDLLMLILIHINNNLVPPSTLDLRSNIQSKKNDEQQSNLTWKWNQKATKNFKFKD